MNERDLFIGALQKTAGAERDDFLKAACGDDAILRKSVEELLAEHQKDASFFIDAPPPGLAAATELTAVTEQPGDTIGPYKLLQQIGEGGMGVVYMAEQTQPVERRVALKIIKPGMDTRQVIARFEAERQALAMMDHPNIAKVLDAGTTDSGRPYFVMELVKGMPVTQYCDEQHLTPRERLELFVPICQAVQHAHQKGIIHRDLKPSNILIAQYDDKPVPKIIDFGVAKAISHNLTEKTMFTQYGQIVGTIEYMSPEQARFNQLDVDTRSDVYSLGVLLYELLTGETPFDKKRLRSAAFDELLRIIREEEPPKPSTKLSSSETLANTAINRKTEPKKLSLLVRGELDWIVMKALEKDRSRRYETANGFAADVMCYLADEPVTACPPSATYRFRKFVRRNKATLATATMVAVALVAGIIGTTWQAVRATREAVRATHEANEAKSARAAAVDAGNVARQKQAEAIAALEQAELQRRQANENFDKARRAVDEYLTQVTESELLTVPGLQPLRENLLQAALKFYAEFTQERADDPSLHRELASAHYRLARIQIDLGNAAASKAANQEAIRLFEQLRDRGDVSVDVQADLASAYFFGARYDDTVKLCQAVLQVEPKQAEVRSLLADTYNQLAVAATGKNDVAAALKHHQQAFELREALVSDFPDNPKYLAQLGGTVNNLGVLLSKQGKQDAALAMFERAVEYSAQAYERAPHSILWGRWLCTGLRNIASNQAALDKQEEALRSYERLVTISRKCAFENPAIGSLRADLYVAYLELGKHQKRLGDATAGSRSFRLAREVLEQIPRETPDQLFELATVYAVLASSVAESAEAGESDADELQRNADLAMETLKKAVDAGYQNASALGTNKDLDPLRARDDFQSLLVMVQTFAEADRLANANDTDPAKNLTSRQQAVDLLKELANSQGGEVRHRTTLAATLHSIGVIQTGLKQFDEAEKSFDEALNLRQELLKERAAPPEALVDVLSTRAAIGQLYWESDRPHEAHRLWQELLALCRQAAADRAEDQALQSGIAGIERSIGQMYGEIGLWPLVAPSLDQSLKTGPPLFDAAWDVRRAAVLAAQGRLEEHREFCQLIAGKWGKQIPAQTVWAATMNPLPTADVEPLLELAEKVIKSDLDPLWKFKAATAYHRAGQYERALEVMLPAREKVVASEGSAGLHWYALVYHKLGQKEVAAKYFDEAEAKYLKSADNSLRGSKKSAVKDAHGGEWWAWAEDQAARRLAWNELRGTVDLHDPWQYLIQARAFQLIGEQSKCDAELAAAEKAWQHYLELAPNDPRPWIQRGRWYTERGEHAKADADFTKAAALTPEELNKFLEAGWWAATTPEGLASLFPKPMADIPAPRAESAAPVSPTVVRSATYWSGQEVAFRNAPEFKDADTAYAMTHIYATERKGVTLLVGGTMPVELRLNGRQVYQWKSSSSHYYLDRVPVLLRPGRNTLVARVSNPGHVNSLILRIGDNRLDRGLELAEVGLWEKALPLLKHELVEGHRLHSLAWNLCGRLLPAAGDFAGYREFCHLVLKWMSENRYRDANACLHASIACAFAPVPQADIEELVRLVDEGAARSTAKEGETWPAHIQSAVYFRAGRYQEVLDRIGGHGGLWQITLRALCWHHLGAAEKAKSELARAEREFRDLVRIVPEGPSSAKVFSHRLGLLDIADEYVLLREARTLIAPDSPPDDQTLHALQAKVRQQLEAADPRLLPFEMALIYDGTNPQRWLEIGRARAELGQWKLAQADFAKAVAMSPNDPEVLATRCLIYANLNRVEEALVDFVKVVDDDSDSAKAPDWLAARQRLFDELGQWPELFDSVTRLRPDDPQPWISRARYHLSRSHWPDAVADEARAPEMAVADLREAVKRGFRDFDQPKSDADWQVLESREDYQNLMREAAEQNPDDLTLLAKLAAHTDVVRSVAFLPDGRRIISVGRDKMVRIWDVETRSVLSTLPLEGYLAHADVSADGRLVAVLSITGEKKAVAQVWNLETGECLCDLVQDFQRTHCIRLSPDGTRVVTGGTPPQGVLWDVATGKELRRWNIDDKNVAYAAAFSPDGRLLALGTVGRLGLFDIESGEVLQVVRLPNNRGINDLVFSPSGKTLATGQSGGHISLIDVASSRVMSTLNPSDMAVRKVRFLNDDCFLLAGFTNGTLQVWDIEREKVVATATTGKGSNERIAVSADGRYAVTAGGEEWDNETSKWKVTDDYALRLWRLPKSVWTEPQRPSSGDAVSEAVEN